MLNREQLSGQSVSVQPDPSELSNLRQESPVASPIVDREAEDRERIERERQERERELQREREAEKSKQIEIDKAEKEEAERYNNICHTSYKYRKCFINPS